MANSNFLIGKNTSVWLDVIRAISAQLVVIGHIYLLYLNTDQTGALPRFVGYVGSLSSEAVVAFFVMSGYLIGGKVLSDIRCGRFNAWHYAADRLTRLWVVLIPTLALTGALDYVSIQWLHGDQLLLLRQPFYPEWLTAAHPWSAITALSNALFLQNITAYQYGTNLSLWSIAHEAWYYVSFPCLAAVAYWKGTRRIAAASAFAAVIAMLWHSRGPLAFAHLAPVWLAGALVTAIPERARLIAAGIFVAVSTALYAGMGFTAPEGLAGNTIVAALVVGIVLASDRISLNWIKRPARFFASYSYSLYAIHLPVLFLLLSRHAVPPIKHAIDAHGTVMLILYTAVLNVAGYAFWFAFESRTKDIRSAINFSPKLTARAATEGIRQPSRY